VRTILNRIAGLSNGEVIWIARVPPSALAHNPKQGSGCLCLYNRVPLPISSLSRHRCVSKRAPPGLAAHKPHIRMPICQRGSSAQLGKVPSPAA
jgi:hypothetical protein